MTLNGVMTFILSYLTEFGSFRGALRKSTVEDIGAYLNFVRQKCRRSPNHLVFNDISLTMI